MLAWDPSGAQAVVMLGSSCLSDPLILLLFYLWLVDSRPHCSSLVVP